MLAAATTTLIETAGSYAASDEEMQEAVQAFFEAAQQAERAEANAAMQRLGEYFDLENAARGSLLALVCGALVERGCDPLVIAKPLTHRLATLLAAAAELADACQAELPAPPEDEAEAEDFDYDEQFQLVFDPLSAAMPHAQAAWEALETFWRPAIAVYSVNPAARNAARPLRELAVRLAEFHEAGHWLQLMLGVLDDEPIVVIEPQTKLGILAKISGVVDNFQLNVLLMDAFPKSGLFARRRVLERVADVARGKGPQQTDDTVTGVWNLYTWRAVDQDLKLPDAGDMSSSTHWVWNEGTPSDIPLFDTGDFGRRRVILLGPASYSRSWGSQRMFDSLPASLEIERQLSKEEVQALLARMLAAR
jgi:hypothetical protein